MSNVMELREKQQKILHDAREVLDRVDSADSETRAKELESQYDALMADHDKVEAQAMRAHKLAEAERAISDSPAPVTPEKKRDEGEQRAYSELYCEYLRGGVSGMSSNDQREFRAQSVGTNSEGGFLVARDFFDELMVTMKDFGPMLDPGVTRQITTATGSVIEWPTMNDTGNKGRRLGENTQANMTQAEFGQKILEAYKYSSDIVPISLELLQDSEIDVEDVIRGVMAERVARIVNEEMTVGTGTGMPNGISVAATTGKTAASPTALDADEIIDLFHSVNAAYRRNPQAAFMFNDLTLKAIRKLKDGQGNYLWQEPNLRTGEPGLFMNKPYAINDDMPDIAAGSSPIIFGDMSRYVVRRVREFNIQRLVERYADFGQVAFVGFGRFDGELIDDLAVKNLTMAAT